MKEEQQKKLISLINKYAPSKKINLGLELSKDLGLEGDDAVDFLREYSLSFNVDMSYFKFEDYFCHEGLNPFELIKNIFSHSRYKKITILDLVEGIESGILKKTY